MNLACKWCSLIRKSNTDSMILQLNLSLVIMTPRLSDIRPGIRGLAHVGRIPVFFHAMHQRASLTLLLGRNGVFPRLPKTRLMLSKLCFAFCIKITRIITVLGNRGKPFSPHSKEAQSFRSRAAT